METTQICPECGSAWSGGQTCQDYFHQMLYWEAEDMETRGVVHHLMVLCYHLQHPSRYSPEGLAHSRALLVDFVEKGLSPAYVRKRDKEKVSSANRKTNIGGRHMKGSYDRPVLWTMTAVDVVSG